MVPKVSVIISSSSGMESLNVKLYEKYKNLKKRKFTEEEEWNHTRDAELRSFQSAVEDLIEELNKENKGLHQQLDSFQEKYDECRMLLLEEGKKSKELSDEVEKLKNLLLKKKDMNNTLLFTSPSTNSKVRSEEISKSPPGQRITEPCEENGTQHKVSTIVTYNNKKTGTSMSYYSCDCNPPQSVAAAVVSLILLFKSRDFAILSSDPFCYSFSLTWIQHEGDEGEWMYHVSSLGTLESIAWDWMKEDIIFSAVMCRDFFERVSLIIGRM
ncbi:hypothetical protein ZIOFF_020310 [Zingiber officinale]|uniref:DUF7806 domain-containing protein n=1 Tax=Zingiber officinale TaxID=94328 RepID=A0A8J5LGK5_ZINOF|nr:hypothetical protein ZIOFF_020310 [Zingiber officinale]